MSAISTLYHPTPFDTRKIPGYLFDMDSRYGLTLDAGGKVSQWDERWGNGVSFSQSTDTKRPTITSDILGTAPALTGSVTNSVELTGNTAVRDLIKNLSGITLYAIYRMRSSGNAALFYAAIPANTTSRISLQRSSGALSASIRVSDTTTFSTGDAQPFLPGIQAVNLVWDNAATSLKLYRNNVLINQNTSTTSGTITNTQAGNVRIFSNGVSNYFDGDLVRLIVCGAAHTDAQRAEFWQGIKSQYNGGLLPVGITKPSKLIQFQGDSITQGYYLTFGTPSLPDRLYEALGKNDSKIVTNFGIAAFTATQLATPRASGIDILPVSSAADVIYIAFAGINDVSGGASDTTAYGNVKALFQGAITARPTIKVIVCTPIAWNGSGTNSTKQSYLRGLRTNILANAVADGATAVCDLGALSEFDVTDQTKADNTTYYLSDKIHPADAGNKVLAAELARVINGI